jgi:hypothetical protein
VLIEPKAFIAQPGGLAKDKRFGAGLVSGFWFLVSGFWLRLISRGTVDCPVFAVRDQTDNDRIANIKSQISNIKLI